MRHKLQSLLIPALLGGAWGIFTYLVGTFILTLLPLASSLFYPVLFGGITVITTVTVKSKIPFERALIVGVISGFIYQILSPIFPVLSSVLVGASLGGGMVADGGKLGDIFDRLISILKGVFLFPVIIYSGGLITGLISGIFDLNFLPWFFWGGWLVLAFCLICKPILKIKNAGEDLQTFSELDEFRSEAHEILREMNQLESKFS